MKRIATLAVGLMLLTGCTAPSEDSSLAPTPTDSSPSVDESTLDDTELNQPSVDSGTPSEWSSTEVKMFNLFSAIYPSSAIMDLNGKRALMENSELR